MPVDESRMTTWSKRVWDSVGWDWVPVDPIVLDAMRMVPPGKALRRYQEQLARARARAKAAPAPHRELTEAEQIASGQRAFVRDAIGSLRTGGHIETEQREEGQYARRRSQVAPSERCPHCGRLDDTVKPGSPDGARSEGLESGDQGDFDFSDRQGVVIAWPVAERPDYESEDLRAAVEEDDEGKDRPAEPGYPELVKAISELVAVVESQGKRIDKTMAVAQSAAAKARAVDLRTRYGPQSTRQPARDRKRTRGGQ